MAHQKLSTLNWGNLLVIAGLGWLGVAFYVPYATADRVTRIHNRALSIAGTLFSTAVQLESIDFDNEPQRLEVLDKTNRRSGLEDPESSLFLRNCEAPPDLATRCFCYRGKHYIYMLTRTPRNLLEKGEVVKRPTGKDGEQRPPAQPKARKVNLEVYAWPRRRGEGTVFFFSRDAPPAFHRNLERGYAGLGNAPHPGTGRASKPLDNGGYRGQDGKHWMPIPDPD